MVATLCILIFLPVTSSYTKLQYLSLETLELPETVAAAPTKIVSQLDTLASGLRIF